MASGPFCRGLDQTPNQLCSDTGCRKCVRSHGLCALHALIVGFVGYIIGLGDRHGSNILVDQLTWGALHIDFGDVSRSSRQDSSRS